MIKVGNLGMNNFRPVNQGSSVLRAAFAVTAALGTTMVIGQAHASHVRNRMFQQHQVKITQDMNQKLDNIQLRLQGKQNAVIHPMNYGELSTSE